MRARVFDKDTGTYFVSEVYAVINRLKYLVVQDIDDKKYFKLFYYEDIYRISENKPEPWVFESEQDLKYLNSKINAENKRDSIYSYYGFGFVLDNTDLLIALFKGEQVPYETILGDREEICSKLNGWNYVETNDDIEYLMDSFLGFHDSVLVSLNYISGSKRVDEGMHVFDDIRQVSMVFDGYSNVIDGHCKSIELVFEGTVGLNLRPSLGIRDSIIYSATITFEDHIISFFDGDVAEYPEDHEYTWIKTYGLRWRVLSEGKASSNFVY